VLVHGIEHFFLVGEILIERPHADPGDIGDMPGGGVFHAVTGERDKAGFDDGADGGVGARLLGFTRHIRVESEQLVGLSCH
jgi:hypothetical protein